MAIVEGEIFPIVNVGPGIISYMGAVLDDEVVESDGKLSVIILVADEEAAGFIILLFEVPIAIAIDDYATSDVRSVDN